MNHYTGAEQRNKRRIEGNRRPIAIYAGLRWADLRGAIGVRSVRYESIWQVQGRHDDLVYSISYGKNKKRRPSAHGRNIRLAETIVFEVDGTVDTEGLQHGMRPSHISGVRDSEPGLVIVSHRTIHLTDPVASHRTMVKDYNVSAGTQLHL